jgi:hypothetical protein
MGLIPYGAAAIPIGDLEAGCRAACEAVASTVVVAFRVVVASTEEEVVVSMVEEVVVAVGVAANWHKFVFELGGAAAGRCEIPLDWLGEDIGSHRRTPGLSDLATISQLQASV